MEDIGDGRSQNTCKESTEVMSKVQDSELEREPDAGYALGLKTWLAVLALAFATSCAVVSTTVLHYTQSCALELMIIDQYHYQVASRDGG